MAYESEKEQDLDHAVARMGQVMDVHSRQSVHPSEKEQENLDCEGVTVARTRTGQVTQTYMHPSPCLVHRVQIRQHGPLLVRVHPSEKEQENLDRKGVTAARTWTGQVTQTFMHLSLCLVHRVQIHQHGALLVHVWCIRLYFENVGDNGDMQRLDTESQGYSMCDFDSDSARDWESFSDSFVNNCYSQLLKQYIMRNAQASDNKILTHRWISQ